MIRVVLVDDQVLMRRGLRGLLELSGAFEVVGEADDGEQALALLAELELDVLLLDVRMPKVDGIQVLHALRNRGTLPPTILLTTFDDDAALLEGAAAGPGPTCSRTSPSSSSATRFSGGGRGDLARPHINERVLASLRALDLAGLGAEQPEALTRRETEVLRLMAGGYTNKEIAQGLGASEGTVKNHASSVFSKLGVRDRTQAVLKALDLGWI